MSNIKPVDFTEAISERYLAYALSTIMSRSLPDVRDGLKPVHRRLLYAMHELKLNPSSGFKKCARVVGDVIGKFHPHGDTAVYDALVRLAQDFAVRYPLIEGQGNFGSIDGDNAAAMRYTESRLTEIALELLRDLENDTVDFRPTYDGEEKEPLVFPAAFPNLLANGAEGIAVGMATSIPPHNLDELCETLLLLLKKPSASVEKLLEIIPGPDFPTGGVIVEPKENILAAYSSGKGSFRTRAKWQVENLSHGMYQVIVTEIPYQVQKSRLIEKMAELYNDKKLPLLSNFRDESAENIRIVLEPKNRQVNPEILMESLFRLSELETRVSLNLNVITGASVPKVLNLREAMLEFLAHRDEVVTRRSKHRLSEIERRLEILSGLLIAYINLDEVIRIIREEDDPKAKMMKKWKLSDIQAEAILNIRLRNLRKLDELEIKRENKELKEEMAALKEILSDEGKRKKVIADEIAGIRKRFGKSTPLGKRRSAFAEAPKADIISIEAFVEKEPITVICSKMGWIRAVKGHSDDTEVKYKEGDEERFTLKASTTDKLLIMGTNGRFYAIGCDKLSRGKGFGEPIKLMIEIEDSHDVAAMFIYNGEEKLLVATNQGKGFVVGQADVFAQTRSGKQVLNLPEGARAEFAVPATGDMVAAIGENRKLLVFKLEEVPEMKRGQGAILQKYSSDCLMSDIKVFTKSEGLTWVSGSRNFVETSLAGWLGKRGGAGKIPPSGFPRSNKFGGS